MNSDTATSARQANAWDLVLRLAETDGVANHAHVRALLDGRVEQRDLADAVHGLCVVHGRYPGMIDAALNRGAQRAAHDWLEAASRAFANERAYLTRLTAAVGPLPSTPGQAVAEGAFAAQRHALEMLAGSDRGGCATGAVAALMLDWHATRRVLDRAAERFGETPPAERLPDDAETAMVIAGLGDTPACERAIVFGAQQLFAQHRGFWDLLDARCSARDRA
ncbi:MULTISPECIES: hypothetical protein [unclassified Sphingomonas]|uniref:DUF6975 family protein n=1 Tax=unclassified Sphingomonas TaxID=196159 RepID=UPI002269CD52|nr:MULTISPECIES: hypothetical protein [unclassified Sphingomonas]